MKGFIYGEENWPKFEWDSASLIKLLGEVRNLQGRLSGKMSSLGFELRNDALVETLSTEIIKSSEIEGELLNSEEVRSSIARRLGIDKIGLVDSSRDVDGVVEMLIDATQNFEDRLTKDRLFGWHSSLFPSGRSGMYKIKVGAWREDTTGPMQVVSGALGKEKVHFQAPSSELVDSEMNEFINWFEEEKEMDLILKAGIAHLWFVTVHPFEDGNGRIARAITDLVLTRSENNSYRFYSMSLQIRKARRDYYEILEKTQKGSLEITNWLIWFLQSLKEAISSSDEIVEGIVKKHIFWTKHAGEIFNERQIKLLNRLFNGFEGKLTTSKWAKIAKTSKDSALRDIQNLIERNILEKEKAGGRSTNYRLVE